MNIEEKIESIKQEYQQLEQQRAQLLQQLQQTEQAMVFTAGRISALEDIQKEDTKESE